MFLNPGVTLTQLTKATCLRQEGENLVLHTNDHEVGHQATVLGKVVGPGEVKFHWRRMDLTTAYLLRLARNRGLFAREGHAT